MGVVKKKAPWYFSWWVLIRLCCTGIGFIPAVILGIMRQASMKHTTVCPACGKTLIQTS